MKSAEAIDETCQHEEALQRPAHPCTEALFGILFYAPKQASFASPVGFDSSIPWLHIRLSQLLEATLASSGPLGPRWAMSGHAIQRTSAPISSHKEKCLLAKFHHERKKTNTHMTHMQVNTYFS